MNHAFVVQVKNINDVVGLYKKTIKNDRTINISIVDGIKNFLDFKIWLKFFFESSSIDKGETAMGSGFKFPLVISTSIKAKDLMGNKINNKNKYLNNILSF